MNDAVRSVSSYRALVAAVVELRSYGHPASQLSDGETYYVRLGRKILVTAPIECTGTLTLSGQDSGLVIEFVGGSTVRDLDLVVDGALVTILGLSQLGAFTGDPLTITVNGSGALFLGSGAFCSAAAVVNDGSLYVMGATQFTGDLYLTGPSSFFRATGANCDGLYLNQTDGVTIVVGSVIDDIDIDAGTVTVVGSKVGTVNTYGGSGSFAYADCESFTNGGGTWTAPVV